MAPMATKITEPTTLGEGPYWHSEDNALYYVGILDHTLNKYEPATGKHVEVKVAEEAHFILPIEGKKNHFLITQARKVVEIEWFGDETAPKILRTITEVDHEFPGNALNDGKADPLGRLFTGTLCNSEDPEFKNKGSLYRIDPDGTTTKLATDIQVSNGLSWDLKEKAFYYIDSHSKEVRRYDYDVKTGNISNPRIVFSLKKHGVDGYPDGMTIDTDGNLWVAVFGAFCVIKFDPRTNTVLEKIPIPTKQVTSVTFGGPNLDMLYVTTACLDFEGKPDYPGGATYAVTGVSGRGHPNLKVRLEI